MRFKLIPGIMIFCGSYFPLALILALQDVTSDTWGSKFCTEIKNCKLPEFNNPIISALVLLFTGFCLLLTCRVLLNIRYKYPIRVIDAKPIPSELISYSFPYIVSFMGVDYDSPGKIAGLMAFLFWIFLITYKAGQLIMNPILIIFGWNLYEARIAMGNHERTVKILSRNILPPGAYVSQEIQGNFIINGVKKND